ncbi:uncharacterized protein LOC116177294 [Photinus pyralis]|uniref:uncharacterized protein LOC116177294 n=1 Tax=Photinus pyralis TaxID=7054 RepID=UPI001267524B|nr:uncharacterized protein LOC116177294 [Photinus pyralis]
MNCLNFEKWFEQQLIPNLDEPSLIIMDNASYHSGLVEKSPNQCWTKMSLIEWLTSRDITFAPTMMQDQIWEVVKNHIPPKLFRLNELALQHGHRVLRLPPYHCEYNPIEMVWSECKRHYDARIGSIQPVTHRVVLSLWNEALHKVTPEKWKRYFDHTRGIINQAWEREQHIDTLDILPVIVNLDESDSDEDYYDDYIHEAEENQRV